MFWHFGTPLKGKSTQKIEFLKKVFSSRKYFYEHVVKISGRYRNRKSFKSYVKNRYFPRVGHQKKVPGTKNRVTSFLISVRFKS